MVYVGLGPLVISKVISYKEEGEDRKKMLLSVYQGKGNRGRPQHRL